MRTGFVTGSTTHLGNSHTFMTLVLMHPTFASMKGAGLLNMGPKMIPVFICILISIAISHVQKMGTKNTCWILELECKGDHNRMKSLVRTNHRSVKAMNSMNAGNKLHKCT